MLPYAVIGEPGKAQNRPPKPVVWSSKNQGVSKPRGTTSKQSSKVSDKSRGESLNDPFGENRKS